MAIDRRHQSVVLRMGVVLAGDVRRPVTPTLLPGRCVLWTRWRSLFLGTREKLLKTFGRLLAEDQPPPQGIAGPLCTAERSTASLRDDNLRYKRETLYSCNTILTSKDNVTYVTSCSKSMSLKIIEQFKLFRVHEILTTRLHLMTEYRYSGM